MDFVLPWMSTQGDFFKDFTTNYEMLMVGAKRLFSMRDDKTYVINQQRPRKVATRQLENWLKEVEKIEHQVNEIQEEYNREGRQWFRHNIQLPLTLGKSVSETRKRISDLIDESSNFDLMADALPHVVETIPTPTIDVETSTYRTLCNILECMRNPNKHKIGIWGMGGVGKTTVMKNLNNNPKLEQIFNIVIWVTVSKDCSIRKIQKEIAPRLSLEFSKDDSDERVARKLYEQFKTKKFLLLMDDVWDKVDLDDVGVPGPEQNGSKVVLTTRYRKVCNQMEADEEIKVEPLTKEEAWKLFRKKAGEVVDLPSIRPVARSVVVECAGLPLAIIVVGASLRKEENIFVWNNALKELSSPSTSNMEDMEEQVFKRLRFSFDRLKDHNLRNCFLYAALFPEDYQIDKDEIIDYWMVEGFISSSLNLVEKRNKGYAILKELADASLLESIDTYNYNAVKMHDLIRDLALKIASPEREGCKFFVRAGTMLKQYPENEEWEQVERMSLMKNEFSTLPERPCCPNLLTLLLQENKQLITIPESFFVNMHFLRVLVLSGTNIESLPPSICNLICLRGLYLQSCHHLKTLPPEIGALTSLEVLDAGGSMMTNLLSKIGKLSHLRVLRLELLFSNGHESVVISSGSIARFPLLEQLITFDRSSLKCHGDWFDLSSKCSVALIEEICGLKKLKSLKIFFPEVVNLEHFLRSSSLWKEGSIMEFDFFVGSVRVSLDGRHTLQLENVKKLTFSNGESIPNAIVEVLGHANKFILICHRSIRELCEFGVKNMNSLKRCIIAFCNGMEIVLDGAQKTDIVLPNLERLSISELPNLKSILNDPLPLGSLANLERLRIRCCGRLEKIFSLETIQQLPNLEQLSVEFCPSLKEVIREEAACTVIDCILPKLKFLNLENLPALVSILKGCSLSCPSLETILVSGCPKLKCLPHGINKASNLKRISCERQWWNTLEWDENAMKGQLEHLLYLY